MGSLLDEFRATAGTLRFQQLVGVGGIGTGIFFALEGDATLGRNESRMGRLLPIRDYCKLHLIAHYPAVLLHAQGFEVIPVGRVGNDDAGRRMVSEMASTGMNTQHVRTDDGRPTLFSVCFQYPGGAGGNITTSDSASSAVSEADLAPVAALLAQAPSVLLAAPEVPLSARVRFLELAAGSNALRVASVTSEEARTLGDSQLLSHVDLLSINEDEAAALGGVPFDAARPEPCLTAVAATCKRLGPKGMRIIVTAGPLGAFGYDNGGWHPVKAPAADVRSTAGAGDALLGGVIAALAACVPFLKALELGVKLASRKVTSQHSLLDRDLI